MTDPIQSLAEARSELERMQNAVARLDDYFERLGGVLGGASSTVKSTPDPVITQEEASRVSQVLSALNALGTASPKQIVDLIKDLKLAGWQNENLYSSVFNTLKYLLKIKKPPLIEKVGEGQYKLLPPLDPSFEPRGTS